MYHIGALKSVLAEGYLFLPGANKKALHRLLSDKARCLTTTTTPTPTVPLTSNHAVTILKANKQMTRRQFRNITTASDHPLCHQRYLGQRSLFPSKCFQEKMRLLQNNSLIPREGPLSTLASQFQASSDNLPCQVIHGFRGSGTTTLAASYVSQYEKDYTRVYWIDSKTIDTDLSAIADDVGIESSSFLMPQDRQLTFQDRRLMLKAWLEAKENQGWLLIVDDLEPISLKLIKELLPESGGHLLATTCDDSVRDDGYFPLKISLQSFSPLEAGHFLLQSSSVSEQDQADATNLVENLGYLPLALAHARAYIKKTGISLNAYSERFNLNKMKFFKNENNTSIVITTWNMNFEEVKKDNPLAQELLPFLAYLYPHRIPYPLLEEWDRLFHSDSSRLALNSALAALQDFTLIEGNKSIYRIHPFIQELIKADLSQEVKNRLLHQAIIVLSKAIDLDVNYRNWPILCHLIPHCSKILENEVAPEDLESIATIQAKMATCFDTQSDFVSAKEKYEEALKIFRKLKTDEHPGKAYCCYNLGIILWKKGDFEGAKEKFEEALRIYLKIHKSEEHPAIADCFYYLGNILRDQRDWEGAKEKYEEALRIYRKIHKTDDHPNIAVCFLSLGDVLQNQGDLEGAKEKFGAAFYSLRRKK